MLLPVFLLFASFDYLDGKILKMSTFTLIFSAECNKATELSHQIGMTPQVGKMNA